MLVKKERALADMDLSNRMVMVKRDRKWENFDSPHKRRNVFCRLAFVFGLMLMYGGAALIIIGWFKDKHIDR